MQIHSLSAHQINTKCTRKKKKKIALKKNPELYQKLQFLKHEASNKIWQAICKPYNENRGNRLRFVSHSQYILENTQ